MNKNKNFLDLINDNIQEIIQERKKITNEKKNSNNIYKNETLSPKLYLKLRLNERKKHLLYPLIPMTFSFISMQFIHLPFLNNMMVGSLISLGSGILTCIKLNDIKENVKTYYRKKFKQVGFCNDNQLPKFIRGFYDKDSGVTTYYFKTVIPISHWKSDSSIEKLQMIFTQYIVSIDHFKGRLNTIEIKLTRAQIKKENINIRDTKIPINDRLIEAYRKLNIEITDVTVNEKEFKTIIQFNCESNKSVLEKTKEDIAHRCNITNMSLQAGIKRDFQIITTKKINTIDFYDYLKQGLIKITKEDNIVLGVTNDSEVKVLNIFKLTHILIAGTTGGGKSNTLNTLLFSLYMSKNENIAYVLCDPKGAELKKYRDMRNTVYATETKDMLTVLRECREEMLRRKKLIAEDKYIKDIESWNRQKSEKMSYIIIAIEEIAELITDSKLAKKKNKNSDEPDGNDDAIEFKDIIQSIAQFGRSMGFRLILCTQYPRADIIDTPIKMNCLTRFAFATDNTNSSRLILDNNKAHGLQMGESIIQLYGKDTFTKIFLLDDKKDKETITEFENYYNNECDVNKDVLDLIETIESKTSTQIVNVTPTPISIEPVVSIAKKETTDITNIKNEYDLLNFYKNTCTDNTILSVNETIDKVNIGRTKIQEYRKYLKNKGHLEKQGKSLVITNDKKFTVISK